MSDNVMPFPDLLQPALKTYAPMGVKFWQGEETILNDMKEFADGWFVRRQAGTKAALEAAQRMGQAATPIEAMRQYQDWLSGAVGRLFEDGVAYQQHFLKSGGHLGATAAEAVAKAGEELPQERRTG
uniref:Phasin domain-containing protein n=1 Tax=Rhodopseudomonas palustris (strain BisA53) TaxID=316055 RepID=Q07NG9_RHOP5